MPAASSCKIARTFDIRKVIARNYHGDGISWQICHDVTVEDCESRDHTGLGLHPGSGSQTAVDSQQQSDRQQYRHLLLLGRQVRPRREQHLEDTKTAGISVGHRDTDNVIRDNTVKRSGKVGILFRPERGAGFTGDRNLVEENTVIDSGDESAAAIDVQGTTAFTDVPRQRAARNPRSRQARRHPDQPETRRTS